MSERVISRVARSWAPGRGGHTSIGMDRQRGGVDGVAVGRLATALNHATVGITKKPARPHQRIQTCRLTSHDTVSGPRRFA